MTLGIEMLIGRMLEGPRWVVGDDGNGILVVDRLPQGVAVISGVGDADICGQVFDQIGGMGASPFCPAVNVNRTGQPSPPKAMWTLVLRPPRERPMA